MSRARQQRTGLLESTLQKGDSDVESVTESNSRDAAVMGRGWRWGKAVTGANTRCTCTPAAVLARVAWYHASRRCQEDRKK